MCVSENSQHTIVSSRAPYKELFSPFLLNTTSVNKEKGQWKGREGEEENYTEERKKRERKTEISKERKISESGEK